ncbi:Aldo/keto reductase [Micromonospora pattaloongensis]|uniref:Aldo/keto reductase n=1 Tax=Micromonospora pattaloongensis TaxID=405436 RepID=A0A1H3FTH1_9ACTN|nr:Aldo/keto reductase [Micromonospora pattaloongensis]
MTLPGDVAIPILGFGTWQATGNEGYEAVLYALQAGYRHIDTATMYGNEAGVGRALRDSGLTRGDVFITTKLPPNRFGRERETIEASLTALGTDHVDLWLIHWPPRDGDGLETWRRFVEIRNEGLARAIGVSNYSLGQLDALTEETGEMPALNQIEWAPSLYDARTLAEHRKRGVVLEGYSPFKNTDLKDPVLTRIAGAHGVTPAQVVIRWHIEHGIVVIPKSVTPERIDLNREVFGFTLTGSEIAEIDALAR